MAVSSGLLSGGSVRRLPLALPGLFLQQQARVQGYLLYPETDRLCAPRLSLGSGSSCTLGGEGAGSETQNLARVGKERHHTATCTPTHLF